MSEYQYYEFQAVDRPLTAKEMSELRSYSSRARITPMSFVVDYAWGSFKGDEDAWMEEYFDAFLYLANWGTHVLKLRLPSRLLDMETARAYCSGDSTFVRERAGKVILSFVSEDEEGGEWVEGEGYLSSLISVRAELARGDRRALYLGWLLQAQSGELDDDDIEPPVPPGLGQLSASLESLAEFLRIDSDLLQVAAEASSPAGDSSIDRDEVRAWVGKLATKEKDEIITELVVNTDYARIAELLQRFLKERAGSGGPATTGRTVVQLLRAAEAYTTERKRIEAEKRAKEKARREREAAIAREKHLDSLVGRESKLWSEVDKLVATQQSKNYDQAVRLLVDLRDLAARGEVGDFGLRIEALRQAHAKKPSLMERLKKASL
jgi:predicted GIY-YIG superfamily endonuclease